MDIKSLRPNYTDILCYENDDLATTIT